MTKLVIEIIAEDDIGASYILGRVLSIIRDNELTGLRDKGYSVSNHDGSATVAVEHTTDADGQEGEAYPEPAC